MSSSAATRTRAAKTPTKSKAKPVEAAPVPTNTFPLAQYASVLGVHLILVVFTVLYLPQSTQLFAPLAPRKTDRPQSEFVEALTADPTTTLGWISLGLALLEVWWANWVRKWSFGQTTKGTEVEAKLDRARFDGLRFTKLKDATMFTLYTALLAHAVIVMFGAPLTTHIPQTALLAFVIAILTAFTPAFVLGLPSLASDTPSMINRLTWTRLFAELLPKSAIECAIVYPAVGTFIGGWLGAIPIALDWDRPWQAWPLTSLFGSVGGYIVGTLWAFALNAARWLAMEHIRSMPSKAKSS